MDGYRGRLLLLVLVGLFGISGAHCPNSLRRYTDPLPPALPQQLAYPLVLHHPGEAQRAGVSHASGQRGV